MGKCENATNETFVWWIT